MRMRLIVFVVVGLFACAQPCAGETLRMSYAGTSGCNVPFWVSYEAGLFKKYGLSSELLLISGGSTNIQGLLANEIQFVNAGATPAIQAILQGAEVVMIASYYNFMPYSFVVNSNIRSATELKRKRLAIARLGGITEFAAKLAFEKLGLGPKDMTLIQAGPDAQRIAAVQSGAVTAAILAPPGLFAATSLGLKNLADLGELGVKYPMGVMIATRSYVVQHRDTVKRFLMALIEGVNLYIHDRDLSIRVMQKYTRLSDPAVLTKSHDYFVKSTTLIPLNDPTAVRNALPEKLTNRKLEEFYDNSSIQELLGEGFVDKLTKK
jgi:NitT/TauT family transport system substrate-binding protein